MGGEQVYQEKEDSTCSRLYLPSRAYQDPETGDIVEPESDI